MKMTTITGWIIFVLSSLLYTLNQIIEFLVFANTASAIIFVILCYFGITLGIALVVFDQFWTQAIIGLISICLTVLLLTAILLIYDSFTFYRYESYEYFILFYDSANISTTNDQVALVLIASGPVLGIMLWVFISRKEDKNDYMLPIFDVILMLEIIICTGIQYYI